MVAAPSHASAGWRGPRVFVGSGRSPKGASRSWLCASLAACRGAGARAPMLLQAVRLLLLGPVASPAGSSRPRRPALHRRAAFPSQSSAQSAAWAASASFAHRGASSAAGLPVVPQVARANCPNDCSGKGQCNEGVCECNVGYTYFDCSLRTCPADCNGGMCFNGTCKCREGFCGASCSQRCCKNGCSGHGQCEQNGRTPTCRCNPGFGGEDCRRARRRGGGGTGRTRAVRAAGGACERARPRRGRMGVRVLLRALLARCC